MASYYGNKLKISVFGQSHGNAIGVNIEGLPVGFEIDMVKLDSFTSRRKPNKSGLSTSRNEGDKFEILSGIVDNKVCGAPSCLIIRNEDARSKDYENHIIPRPGHADLTTMYKYGNSADYKGGGHFSGRLTAPLCIAGGIAKQILEENGIYIGAHIKSIHGVEDVKIDMASVSRHDFENFADPLFPTFSAMQGEKMKQEIITARENLDSVGGVIECAVIGMPKGAGTPMFDGIENRIATMIFGIGGIKGIEFGSGFAGADMYGSENNDDFYFDGNKNIYQKSNNAGGILGGISTGMPIVFAVAVKPTPSISKEQHSINIQKMENATMSVKGRHDPCIVPRAVPCIEAAAAIAVLDILLVEGFINERKYLENPFEKHTKRGKFGLLGEKLGHSFSPEIHSMLGEYSYKLFEVEPDKVADFIKNVDFDGLNVTIPYKKVVMELCDEVSEQAKKIGCVNTVKRRNGKLYGCNTDYDGFRYLLTSEKIEINGKKCLVLGTGASSGTVKAVLEDMGASEIVFVSRNGENNYENIEKHHDAQVIVNTTPVGMYPNNGECKVKLRNFTALESCVDIVYNPLKTDLIIQAEKLGIKNASGLSMLVAQAKYAAEIFTENSISDSHLNTIINKIHRDKSNIVIIGMPGSGKSSVGRLIAKNLDRKFIDADKYFEQKMGMAPGDYITQHGEELFRKEETEVLSELGKMSGVVISTGGGAVTRAENYNHLHQNGKIVLIKRSFERLATRGRPLSQGDNALIMLWEKRRDAYKAFADVEVDNNRHISKTVETVLRRLGYENSRY